MHELRLKTYVIRDASVIASPSIISSFQVLYVDKRLINMNYVSITCLPLWLCAFPLFCYYVPSGRLCDLSWQLARNNWISFAIDVILRRLSRVRYIAKTGDTLFSTEFLKHASFSWKIGCEYTRVKWFLVFWYRCKSIIPISKLIAHD